MESCRRRKHHIGESKEVKTETMNHPVINIQSQKEITFHLTNDNLYIVTRKHC